MKLIGSILLLFLSIQISGQVTIKLDGIPITKDHQYDFFYYPEIITIENNSFDSLRFTESSISYFSLKDEKRTTENIDSTYLDINPTRILSASVDSKRSPIIIEFGKIYGFKNGKKNLILKNETYKINHASSKFSDPRQIDKINSSSKLSLKVGNDMLTSFQIPIADTSKSWELICPGNKIVKGEILIIEIMTYGAPRPVFAKKYNSESEMKVVISNFLPTLRKDQFVLFTKVKIENNLTGIATQKMEHLVIQVK